MGAHGGSRGVGRGVMNGLYASLLGHQVLRDSLCPQRGHESSTRLLPALLLLQGFYLKYILFERERVHFN